MIARSRPKTDKRTPRPDLMVDACVRCSRPTPPAVVASDLEGEATVGGYVCVGCGVSWFTSYLLGADDLAEVLAARRVRARALDRLGPDATGSREPGP